MEESLRPCQFESDTPKIIPKLQGASFNRDLEGYRIFWQGYPKRSLFRGKPFCWGTPFLCIFAHPCTVLQAVERRYGSPVSALTADLAQLSLLWSRAMASLT